jgi:DNA polymerase III alpha subunit
MTLEDLTGETDVIVFPVSLEKYGPILGDGEVVLVTAEASLEEPFGGEGEDVLKLLMKTIAVAKPDSDIPDNDMLEKSLYLKITPSNQAYLSAALARIKQSKGKNRLYVYYEDRTTTTRPPRPFDFTLMAPASTAWCC